MVPMNDIETSKTVGQEWGECSIVPDMSNPDLNPIINYPMNEYVQRENGLFRQVDGREVLVKCHWYWNTEDAYLMDQWGFIHQVKGCSSGLPVPYRD